jgi:hypothetical protein
VKLREYGDQENRSWFQQILEWSRNKLSFEDNLDCVIITASIATSETIVGHTLGRVPKGVIPILQWPNNTSVLTWGSKPPDDTKLYLKQSVDGKITLLVF